MLCFEVAVNGERYCLAGADDSGVLFASVASRGPISRFFGSKFELVVSGLGNGAIPLRDSRVYWGGRPRRLKSADVVTIRVVESPEAETPRLRPDAAGAVSERELFADTAKIRDGLGGFLFWLAVAALGAVLSYCTPHR
jgi:hypothetical protein